MATMAEVRGRVRLRLEEQVAAVWADVELDEAITATLDEYNLLFQREASTNQAISEGATSVAEPSGARGIVRITLESGLVLPERGQPVGETHDERQAWERYAGTIYFTRPLQAQTLVIRYLADHDIASISDGDVGLLVNGAIWRALEQRSVQDLKRGGPLRGVAYDLVIRQARAEYQTMLDLRRRRMLSRLITRG